MIYTSSPRSNLLKPLPYLQPHFPLILRTANSLVLENSVAAENTAVQEHRSCHMHSTPHYPKLTLLLSRLCAHHSLPLWLKMPSISMLLREWAMQREPQGTRPSAAGDRSVVRTRHQSGLSWGLSSTSTVCPRRIVSSLLLQAVKSWITTVSSHPPDNCGGKKRRRSQMNARYQTIRHAPLPI